MKKLLSAVSAVALFGLVGAANADEEYGKIKSVDEASRTLVLEDGTSFEVMEGVAMTDLKPGEDVEVSYQMKDGKKVADKIELEE